jgi:hypothetical protein
MFRSDLKLRSRMQVMPIGIALLGAVVAMYFFSAEPSPSANPGLAASVSDLLACLIAITGVTTPLLIAYSLQKEIDIRVDIAEIITRYYAERKISQGELGAAVVHLRDKRGKVGEAGLRLLEVLGLCLNAKDLVNELTQQFEPFPKDAIEEIFGKDQEKKHHWFSFFFDNRCNRACAQFYVVVLALLALACFVDLHARVRGGMPTVLSGLEEALIWATFLVNFAMYLVIAFFAVREVSIRSVVVYKVRHFCRQAQGDMNEYLTDAKTLREEVQRDMRAGRKPPSEYAGAAAAAGPGDPRTDRPGMVAGIGGGEQPQQNAGQPDDWWQQNGG